MIKTTRTIAAALILTLAPGLSTRVFATERPETFVPLRDDALGHAVLDIFPNFDVLTEPEPEPQPAPDPSAQYPAEQAYGDPYGFAAIINNYRASAGLPPLAYDPNLAAWASQNNAAQCSRGLGHHIMANFFQNCGYNQTSVLDIAISWMNSPGHAQNMLAPSATRFGIAYGPGPYWTMNLQ
ncbi:CAP domain-containing protein [Tautonia marina]|uniref:CAP domain-containing protein n=1 Tax=Tautonia marina TaxID=2653855 RepID=UPI001375A9F4|nr:CAP domain-containing protein [Tautonia marina]